MQSIQNRTLLYETSQQKPLPACDSIPAGLYPARLDSVTRYQGGWSERVGFVFHIAEGKYLGKTVTLSTATNLNRQSKLGETLHGLLGRELSDAEVTGGFDPECLVGTECDVLVMKRTNRSGKAYLTVDRIL
jgi:hypothetical protein